MGWIVVGHFGEIFCLGYFDVCGIIDWKIRVHKRGEFALAYLFFIGHAIVCGSIACE